jgi:hypothetical protein
MNDNFKTVKVLFYKDAQKIAVLADIETAAHKSLFQRLA